ncbi:MAG TPA: TIGR02680 family protein [Firmicutes bacterium]|nr:TIGR02680 family protein [Bacillota bacterium]
MPQRWKMNRAGLLNFWYYDDAEFVLEDGRLILRGANSSGKSVTMQSFIPLVLDGDKRPWRLDPFGSRDRRIEYYLLLDGEDGHNERTAYLYLEFQDADRERYLTIGIGLRGRRNVAGVNFWGFVITDNRRINKDFKLYRSEHGSGEETKIPLTRNELAARIGEGGTVVTEQGEYERLVNKHLFGYADENSYGELLDLLIQLRSPKLSKDFKPTTIYEILTGALPTLQEDELRPLEEVLGEMDEIADHLAELEMHRQEADKLQKAYQTYNEALLLSASREVLFRHKERHKQAAELDAIKGKIASSKALIAKAEHEQNEFLKEEKSVEGRISTLAQHEAISTEDELQRVKEQIHGLEHDKACVMRRWNQAQARLKDILFRIEALKAALAQAEERQQRFLGELDTLAQESRFLSHDVYVQPWRAGTDEASEIDWDGWRGALKNWAQHLEQALLLAENVQQRLHEKMIAEKQLGEARRRRDETEISLRRQETAWDEAVEGFQEQVFHWKNALQELRLAEETMQEILRQVSLNRETGTLALEALIRPKVEEHRYKLQQEYMTLEFEKKGQERHRTQLLAELRGWESQQDPEPLRTEERQRSRLRRQGTGAPFYALCDFDPEVDAQTRAVLESVLQQAGLLDAWVQTNGMVVCNAGEEEVWIDPAPLLSRCTLADYLKPVVCSGDGYPSAAAIDSILRTISVDPAPLAAASPSPTAVPDPVRVSMDGTYRLGSLIGQAAIKPRAEFIGEESRRRTRHERISALRVEINGTEVQIADLAASMAVLEARMGKLAGELARFPKPVLLSKVEMGLRSLQAAYEFCQDQLEQDQKIWYAAGEMWQEAVLAFKNATSGWFLETDDVEKIRRALACCRDYYEVTSEFETLWKIYCRDRNDYHRLLEDQEAAAVTVAEEQNNLPELEDRLHLLSARAVALEDLLNRLGLSEVHRELEELRERSSACQDRRRSLEKDMQAEQLAIARHEVALQAAQQNYATIEQGFRESLAGWQRECKLGLVAALASPVAPTAPEGGAEEAEGAEAIILRCNEIVKALSRQLGQRMPESSKNAVYDTFYATNQMLQGYVPAIVQGGDGERILVVFMRDRQNPITPLHLLQELETAIKEQHSLLSTKDRELFERVILHSVGEAIRRKIFRAEEWVEGINKLMAARVTSGGFKLQLRWEPQSAQSGRELDTEELVRLLKTDVRLLRTEQIEQIIEHFRTRVQWAKEDLSDDETLKDRIRGLLDYRNWFHFTLFYQKGQDPRKELTDARFNVLSGGEKAMAMYVPLLSAVHSRYQDARPSAPRIISLDEAFAGVDEENLRDMFELLTQLDLDYIMTSQILWGCYDTVPRLAIYELLRPSNAHYVARVRYRWNGKTRELIDQPDQPDRPAEALL